MGYTVIAAAAAALMLAGAAQAQPYYGEGDLPPPPYAYVRTGHGGGGCHEDHFTLLGAHAGVTVLGVDLGASAHLGVPYERGCGGGYAEEIVPRAYAPPPPVQYAPPSYAYQGVQGYGYAPAEPPPRPMGWGCGCAIPGRW